jgi:methionyl-tRNA formyltransferase
MRIGFMGSPAYALPTLERLHERYTVSTVVAQPARPAGRGQQPTVTAVEAWAREHHLPVFTPPRIAQDEDVLRALKETDVTVTVAYGQRLPEALLSAPKHGILNAHGSLLPAYRGAAPLQHALLDGLAVTGVTVMRTEAGMDTGPICLTRQLTIPPNMTLEELMASASHVSADAVLAALDQLQQGTLVCEPQDDAKATRAPQIVKEDGRILWEENAIRTYNRWRAFHAWPGLKASYDGRTVRLKATA